MRKWIWLLLLSAWTFPGVFNGPALSSLSDHVRSVSKVFERPIILSGEQESGEGIASQLADDLYGGSEELSLGIYQATIGVMCFVGLIAVIGLSVVPMELETRLIGLLLVPLIITVLGSAYAVFVSTVARMVIYNYWKTGDCPKEFESILH